MRSPAMPRSRFCIAFSRGREEIMAGKKKNKKDKKEKTDKKEKDAK
jgi:hypothetical protein